MSFLLLPLLFPEQEFIDFSCVAYILNKLLLKNFRF